VTPETVRAWYRRGWIPAFRAGCRPLLFDPDEVERALRVRAKRTAAHDRGAENRDYFTQRVRVLGQALLGRLHDQDPMNFLVAENHRLNETGPFVGDDAVEETIRQFRSNTGEEVR
jgi:hypothetical protein